MSILEINGREIHPAPTAIEATLSALDKYAERDVNTGLLQREIASKKWKYTISWDFFEDQSEFNILWNILANIGEFATFRLPDPNSGKKITIEGYIGDITTPMRAFVKQGEISVWKSLKVNIIER